MSDQIVYLCGCEGDECCVENPVLDTMWRKSHVGDECAACDRPIRAVNITELEEAKKERDALKAEVEYLHHERQAELRVVQEANRAAQRGLGAMARLDMGEAVRELQRVIYLTGLAIDDDAETITKALEASDG